eukprot:TRINITY_DN1660_c0_g1_i5.p1 TRINITY_DN1660_c0_g1~~TRINITY_DN1660_c0_g1_i5.p1  ORF type:complete len:219 (-),score=56.87 TRINITY_DN1660_c0_g1_i5:113-769(-)
MCIRDRWYQRRVHGEIMANFKGYFAKQFGLNTVYCNRDSEVSMDDPSYAKVNPELNYDDYEPEQMPLANKFPRRPPGFEVFMNSIRAISKKTEAVKGFKFEIGAGASNNFHVAASWNINPVRKNPQAPMGSFTFTTQYLQGQLRTFYDQPSFILTGRWESTGQLQAAFIKKLSDRVNLRITAQYPNSDLAYSQVHADLDIDGEDYTCLLYTSPSPRDS